MPELRSKNRKVVCARRKGEGRADTSPLLPFPGSAERTTNTNAAIVWETHLPRCVGTTRETPVACRCVTTPMRFDRPERIRTTTIPPSMASASNPKETLEASSPPRERIDPSVGFQRALLRSVCRKRNTRRPRSGRSVPSSVRLFEPTPPWLLILSKRENNKRKENEEEG